MAAQTARYQSIQPWSWSAIYLKPDGTEFKAFFGIDVYAPKQTVSWSTTNEILSRLNYYDLWWNGDISKNSNGSFSFSNYAQRKIIADACDYASYWASKGVKSGDVVTSNAYKAEFKVYFDEWFNQYLPGATMQILHGNQSGTVMFKSTYGDPETCQ